MNRILDSNNEHDEAKDALRELLTKTRELIEYFPQGYDFGVDPYHPLMIEFYHALIEQMHQQENRGEEDQNPESPVPDPVFVHVLHHGINTFITLNVRYDLYEKLNTLKEKVRSKEHRKLLDVTQKALEDESFPCGMLQFVTYLFLDHIFRILESDSLFGDTDQSVDPKVDELLEKLKNGVSNRSKIINELAKYGTSIISRLEKELFEETDIPENESYQEALLELFARIPDYRAGYALFIYALEYDELDVEELVRIVHKSKVRPYLVDFLLNELSKPWADMYNRWICYELLVGLREYRVTEYLRREFSNPDYWEDFPADTEAGPHFYGDVADWLVTLGDRRAIPEFILIIAEPEEMGFSEEIAETIKEVALNSSWSRQIQKDLRRYEKGEIVFVGEEDSLPNLILDELDALEEAARRNRKEVTQEQVSALFRKVREDWNRAYHRSLDGLRPVDFPTSPVLMKLQQHMLSDIDPELDEILFMEDEEKSNEQAREIEDKWWITPNPRYKHQPPIKVRVEEEKRLANTPVLRELWEKKTRESIAELYGQACIRMDAGNDEEARLFVNAVLALDPDHPFARRLQDILGKPSIQKSVQSKKKTISISFGQEGKRLGKPKKKKKKKK
ncbi:MAG: hypothetical protein D6681_20885 [Calditrichaeota bacterium]|nr:MAG: hypothetical protein D6681_20885 [Calditrichota bacterium]